MTETTVSPNNRAVVYRGKPQRERPRMSGFGVSSLAQDSNMPVVSKAQNGAMHAAAAGESTLGIPAAVGREFTADQKPGSVKKLPQRAKGRGKQVAKLQKRGLVSDAQGERLNARYGGQDQQGIDASSR